MNKSVQFDPIQYLIFPTMILLLFAFVSLYSGALSPEKVVVNAIWEAEGQGWLQMFQPKAPTILVNMVKGQNIWRTTSHMSLVRTPVVFLSLPQIECQSYGRGTHLTSILTWPETLIVSKHISTYKKEEGVDVWIGLHDTHQNGRWRWSDESTYNYKNWMHGEPNNLWNSEYCVALRASTEYKGWIDAVCKKLKAYICKHEL
ncbi:C-type lectin [Varanus komodoensis]|nr:C-type lectin [Varanus komodoensis]